jgi:hypothetical protein
VLISSEVKRLWLCCAVAQHTGYRFGTTSSNGFAYATALFYPIFMQLKLRDLGCKTLGKAFFESVDKCICTDYL